MHFVLRGYGTRSINHTRHVKQHRKLRGEISVDTAKYSGLPPGTVFTLAFKGHTDKTSKFSINTEASICLISETIDEYISFSAAIINKCYLERTNDGSQQKTRINYDFELGFQPKFNADSMLKTIITLRETLDMLVETLISHQLEGLK